MLKTSFLIAESKQKGLFGLSFGHGKEKRAKIAEEASLRQHSSYAELYQAKLEYYSDFDHWSAAKKKQRADEEALKRVKFLIEQEAERKAAEALRVQRAKQHPKIDAGALQLALQRAIHGSNQELTTEKLNQFLAKNGYYPDNCHKNLYWTDGGGGSGGRDGRAQFVPDEKNSPLFRATGIWIHMNIMPVVHMSPIHRLE